MKKAPRHPNRYKGRNQGNIYTGYEQVKSEVARIPVRGIACLDCPAEAGEPCVASTGKTMSSVHVSRRRRATRKYNAEAAQREAAKPVPPLIDNENGRECPTCHLMIKTTKSGKLKSHTSEGYGPRITHSTYPCLGEETV